MNAFDHSAFASELDAHGYTLTVREMSDYETPPEYPYGGVTLIAQGPKGCAGISYPAPDPLEVFTGAPSSHASRAAEKAIRIALRIPK